VNLRGKILVAELPLAACLALVAFLAVETISSLGLRSDLILRDNYRSVLAAQRMIEAIDQINSGALLAIVGEQDPEAAAQRARFESELGAQENNISEPGEKEATARLRTQWQNYQADADKLLALSDPKAAKDFYLSTLRKDFAAVKSSADDVLALNQDAMVRKSDRTRAAARRMEEIMIAAGIGAFLLGIFGSISLTNRVLGPMNVLSQAVRRLGEGDLQARASISGKDEIAALAAEFNAMAKRLVEYRSSSLGELLQAQQASQAAIDSLPDPVIVFGLGGEVLNINRAAESILGVSLDRGKDVLTQVDPKARAVLEGVPTRPKASRKRSASAQRMAIAIFCRARRRSTTNAIRSSAPP